MISMIIPLLLVFLHRGLESDLVKPFLDDPLYEAYNDNSDNGSRPIYYTYWEAQSFTVGAEGHTITSVKIKAASAGSPTLVVGIRSSLTGADLTTGSVYAGGWSLGWHEIVMDSEIQLSPNTVYYIVCRCPGTPDDGSSQVGWRLNTSGTYPGGDRWVSFNSGASWTETPAWDYQFEVWGNPLGTPISVSDAGVGTESISIQATIPVSDAGVGAEVEGIEAAIPVSDAGSGAEALLVEATLSVSDEGLGSEYELAEYYTTVRDAGLAAEFVWRLKGYCRVDSFDLPHVLSITITDEAAISDKKIQDGSLPRRKMVGKPGRVVEINGWTKSQTDIDSMEPLVDGAAHVFLHPSGDSFAVRVKDFDPDRNIDRYDRRVYRMTLVELGTW